MSVSGASQTSSKRYSIVEPHPSVPSTHYLTTGRGGAGNVTRAPTIVTAGSDASGPAARTLLCSVTAPRKTFTAGRGGAGNVYPSSERAIFSFDEELEAQLAQERHAAPVYHVGRGGAGNKAPASSSSSNNNRLWLDVNTSGAGRRRSSDQSFASTSSAESGADVFNRNIKKSIKKVMGVGY
ncbi:hypothetical protein EDD37DRAFT_629625 [Exophiala viscosa]|uniref:uncharacterized protein n=1 Tax=Exophiala viscosa TaxID=2486360 RepID=UPI00219737DC|nr:hypothetical protein EDD37DRAFT_629625 [Exophiala viscosa]